MPKIYADHSITDFIKSRDFFIPAFIILIYSIILCFIPLVNNFSYEFNLFLTIPVSLISAYITISFLKKFNRNLDNI